MAAVRVLVMILAIASFAATPASQPAGQFEQQSLRAPASRQRTSAATQASAGSPYELDSRRVAMALAIVLLLIGGVWFVMKRFFPQSSAPRAGSAMKVLSRLPINPRQQVLMIQVGNRVVVVGDSGQAMNPLTVITDPDEIAQLHAMLTPGSHDPKSFGNLFGKAGEKFDDEEQVGRDERHSLVIEKAVDTTQIEAAHSEMHGLIDKVRKLSSQLRKDG